MNLKTFLVFNVKLRKSKITWKLGCLFNRTQPQPFIIQERYTQVISFLRWKVFPANIYLFKVRNRNTRKRSEICSVLTIKTPERHQLRRSGVFIVNFEHISHLFLVFLLLTLNIFHTFF